MNRSRGLWGLGMDNLSPRLGYRCRYLAWENTNMTLGDSKWYAVRSVFRHDATSTSSARHTFEERIVLFLAMDEDDAIAKAEREADAYDGHSTGYFMSYELVEDGPLGSGHELFSLMRDSDLTMDEYLDRFHDTGTERSRTVESD